MTTTAAAPSYAVELAGLAGDDGSRPLNAGLIEAWQAQGRLCVVRLDDGGRRLAFADGSRIVVDGSGTWDVAHDDCDCWLGVGGHNEACTRPDDAAGDDGG